ncbi:ABC transporter ecdL [Colletotrichum spaethianum]|uniref:ABC transporter ecdL n=1 Tax=Colletotrichum spaethianum TaxID=700344 RepID=A0AA37LH74_9PEZI|nr:ABC transporter ecdL [Colletotrichum spaethianum]GKT46470.1 ABC transporter ecdL [Colletotrichum spaethianum]
MFLICTPIWSPILTFSTFVGTASGNGDTLTIQKAFTAYSLLILVNQPLVGIVMGLPILAAALASFQRIQDFLNGNERSDNRLITDSPERDVKTLAGKLTSQSPAGKSVPIQDLELFEMQKSGSDGFNLAKNVVISINGTFSWSDDSKPVIDIENWNVKRGAFTLILGPVGCGKSTLLKALLGELSSFKGAIHSNFASITYCGQTAWIPNDTVRNIIVGHKAFDPSWYQTVVRACALEKDISSWPKGENTVAGTKGISMSGGQKHRLAIARALYARQELMLLDDVFSGLDSTTEEIVFSSLFGSEGLLRNTDTTVVLASSDSGKPARSQIPGKETVQSTNLPKGAPRQAENRNDMPTATVLDMLEDQADATRQLGDWGMYRFYAKGAGWLSLTTFASAMVVFAFYIWLKWWAESNETRPNQDLGKWLGVYAALGVGSGVSVLFGMWQLFIVIINKSGVYFHGALLDTTSRAPMSFHSSVDSGITVNRFSQDLQLIDMELPSAALGLAIGLHTYLPRNKLYVI